MAFLNGIMHVLITEGLYDKEFVAANCEDFEALKATVMKYPPERAAQISGVSVEVIQQIARTMAATSREWPAIRLGITEHTCGKNNVMSVSDLQLLLGNIGHGEQRCEPAARPEQRPGRLRHGSAARDVSRLPERRQPGEQGEVRQGVGCGGKHLSDKYGLRSPI